MFHLLTRHRPRRGRGGGHSPRAGRHPHAGRPPAAQATATSPADYVAQAARAWDGADGAAPAPQEAQRLMAAAVEAFQALAAAHPQDTELAAYTAHLEKVRQLMGVFAGFDAGKQIPQDKDLQGLSPGYLALELLALPDTDAESLRRRLTCIQARLEGHRDSCLLRELAAPDLSYVELRTARLGSKDYLGLTSWFTDATSFGAKMEFYMDNMPPAGEPGAPAAERLALDLRRAVIVNDTLAHELTHIYFCSRYPKISSSTEDNRRMVYEGHAICTAYAFVRDTYFRGKLPPEQYRSLMLSPRYSRYFQWYRSNILTPEGVADWAKLDKIELLGAPAHYYVRTRAPHTSFGRKARPYTYFGSCPATP